MAPGGHRLLLIQIADLVAPKLAGPNKKNSVTLDCVRKKGSTSKLAPTPAKAFCGIRKKRKAPGKIQAKFAKKRMSWYKKGSRCKKWVGAETSRYRRGRYRNGRIQKEGDTEKGVGTKKWVD